MTEVAIAVDHRWDSPPKIRFAPDSPREGDGFEPSVPGKIIISYHYKTVFRRLRNAPYSPKAPHPFAAGTGSSKPLPSGGMVARGRYTQVLLAALAQESGTTPRASRRFRPGSQDLDRCSRPSPIGDHRPHDSLLEGTGFEPPVPLLRKTLLGVANRRRRHDSRRHLQVEARGSNACMRWLLIAFPFPEGPRVRIHLPPAESPQTIGSRTARFSAGYSRRQADIIGMRH